MCGAPDLKEQTVPEQPKVNSDAIELTKKRVRDSLAGQGSRGTIRTGPGGALQPAQTVQAKLLGGG